MVFDGSSSFGTLRGVTSRSGSGRRGFGDTFSESQVSSDVEGNELTGSGMSLVSSSYDVVAARERFPGYLHQAGEVFAVLSRILYPFLREKSPLGIPTDDFELPRYPETEELFIELNAAGQGVHYGNENEAELSAAEIMRDPPMPTATDLERLWRAFMVLEMIGVLSGREKRELLKLLGKLMPAWRVKQEMVLVAGELVRRLPNTSQSASHSDSIADTHASAAIAYLKDGVSGRISRAEVDYCWRHAYAHPDEILRIRSQYAIAVVDLVTWCAGLLHYLLGEDHPVVIRARAVAVHTKRFGTNGLATLCQQDGLRYFADS